MVLHIDISYAQHILQCLKQPPHREGYYLNCPQKLIKPLARNFVQVCTASGTHMQLQGMVFSLLPDKASHMVVQLHQGGQWLSLSGQLLVY